MRRVLVIYSTRFKVCLTLASKPDTSEEVRVYTEVLVRDCGVTPVDIGLFGRWNEPMRIKLAERLILKAPHGDFRDMEAVATSTWSAEEIVGVAA
jgi:hypothetical protein